ncbi:MAG: carboxypeptidase-like regulatory domain-containing protein [Cyclobacteriaceae bacterium]|nr:carboxypeptidase-like regulatory domain-containing protein [Cyclobacteriaceae bacterium]
MIKNSVLLILLSFCSFLAYSQNGTIRGKVIDNEFGDELIGATVVISGTTIGSVTDLEGAFTIANLSPSIYSLEVSYVGYETKKITGISVEPEEITIIDIRLGGDVEELEEIVVMAEALKSSESGVLTAQKKSLQVVDGMGVEQFSRGGDSDAGSAIKRITGISVEGGKYVYVRGLGDRYSKTSLNGADIPGLDPNRNTVQMDLFPTNLIDNIMVYKTFSPELPGDFTGGYVNVETKDFPDKFNLQYSVKMGVNPQANLNSSFLTHSGGKLDIFGINDGTRDIPSLISSNTIPNNGGTTPEEVSLLNQMGNSFSLMEMQPGQKMKSLNQSHAWSLGNQRTLFGKPFGYITGVSYSLSYENFDNGKTGRFTMPGQGSQSLITQLDLNDHKSTESVLWGAFANFSSKLSTTDKISLTLMRNQSSDKTSRVQAGKKPEDDPDLNYETRALMFQERSISSAQLKGEHVLVNLGGSKLKWISSYTLAGQNEPDLRFFTYGSRTFGDQTYYSIEPSIGQLPTRYFREMNESHFDNKLHFTLPLGENGTQGKIKAGAAYVVKNRHFRENQYRYSSKPTPPDFFTGDPNKYISADLLGTDSPYGTFIMDAYDASNNYDGSQYISSGYAMIEKNVGEKIRIVAGGRLESTRLSIESFDANDKAGKLNATNFLPSISGSYSLRKDMNLKWGFSKTLARPTFREMAPFASFDFIGDYLLVGNPGLKQTEINNLDIRWENYIRQGEILAIGAFYKDFTNPIEKTFNVAAANGNELTWRNTPHAVLYGIEAEFRKRLDFISPQLFRYTVGSNVTYLKSLVDIDASELSIIRAFDPNASSKREMFGQSPYVVNSFISYDDFDNLSINATYYINGDRLSVVTSGGTPNVIENARGILNVNMTKTVGKFALKFSANNLLNPAYNYTQTFLEKAYVFQNYKVGRTFTLGFNYKID